MYVLRLRKERFICLIPPNFVYLASNGRKVVICLKLVTTDLFYDIVSRMVFSLGGNSSQNESQKNGVKER